MIKRFQTTANPILSSVVNSIETSLECQKFKQVSNRIEICLHDNMSFQAQKNRELASKGFGNCLIKSYDNSIWEVFIVINIKNCIQANLTETEIAAVVLHELGHILNEPELQVEPTFEFCFIHGIEFKREVLEEVRESNCMSMEIFADSYAKKHGYGKDLISTFHKQNENFEQKIEYCEARIEKILGNEHYEGKIMSPSKDRR